MEEIAGNIQKGVPKRIIILLVVIIGLIASLYLIREQQFFRPRASSDVLEIKDQDGSSLPLEWGTPVTEDTTVLIELKEAPEP